MLRSLVFAFNPTALIPDHSLSYIFTLQKRQPHLSFATCYQPRGGTIRLCHTLISVVRLDLSRNGSKHHAWRSRQISHSSTRTSLSYTSNHFACRHVSFHEVTAFVTPAIPIAMMSNTVLLISTQPGLSSCFRTAPCNKHSDPKH